MRAAVIVATPGAGASDDGGSALAHRRMSCYGVGMAINDLLDDGTVWDHIPAAAAHMFVTQLGYVAAHMDGTPAADPIPTDLFVKMAAANRAAFIGESVRVALGFDLDHTLDPNRTRFQAMVSPLYDAVDYPPTVDDGLLRVTGSILPGMRAAC